MQAQILGDNPNVARVGVDLATKLRRAELHFQFFSYKSSVDLYHQVVKKKGATDELRLNIAECYRKLNWQDSAASWYSQIEDLSVLEPLHYLYYAQALQYSGNYEEAKIQYQKYHHLASTDTRASLKIEAIDNREDYYLDSALYTVKEVPINTPEADFAPSYFMNGFIFASARERPALIQKKFKWNQKPYLDLYYAEVIDGSYADPVGLSNRINSKFHEGPITTYQNGRKMIFTRNNFLQSRTGKSEDGIVKLKLYSAEISDEQEWSNIQELPFNSDEYSVGHPTISRDGKTLYFVSDMPGGFGGTDIWVSTYDSIWSEPVNLGGDINSEGDEMFPFIHDENSLYFASNGYGGLGGLDIYKTWIVQGEQPSGVINLGYPVNTTNDDFAVTLDEAGKKGYFSSNREGGTGDDDIYALILNRIVVDAYLVDKATGEPILGGSLFALDNTTQRPVPILKNANRIQFDAMPSREYVIKGSKEGYFDKTVVLPVGRLEGEERITVRVELEKITPVDILIIENISGKRQNFVLSDSVNLYDGSEEQLQASLAARNIQVGQVIRISNIYFDLDKSFIREDAVTQLDRMAKILHRFPYMTLAMDAHADSRASNSYNDALSSQRVKSTTKYFVENGIPGDRLIQSYFGERNLVNDCGNDVLCTEAQHQFNRRTEFEITKY
jgi:outer membrane protein OmpA-like peptidoglycan-associated protein/tetratricopeptide (TPR) repeat protein